jgi:hypothetical protein
VIVAGGKGLCPAYPKVDQIARFILVEVASWPVRGVDAAHPIRMYWKYLPVADRRTACVGDG